MLTRKRLDDRNFDIIIADSVDELADAVVDATRVHHDPVRTTMTREFLGRDFSNLEQARGAVGKLWEDEVSVVEAMLEELSEAALPQPKSRRRRRRWSEEHGDEIDLDRLRNGTPFWRESRRQIHTGPANITVISDMRAPWYVDHKDILWRGAAAIALTHLLERSGYRVELWAAQAEKDAFEYDGHMFVAARVKKTSEPLDLGACVASVSAWFYRLFGFGAANIASGRSPTHNAGYDWPGGVSDFADELAPQSGRVIVEGVWNHEDAVKFIQAKIEELKLGGSPCLAK